MTVNAYERGRKLILDVGEEGDDDMIRITIKPVNSTIGAALQALHAGILFGQSEELERDAELQAKYALGEENWDVVQNELRWAEAQAVINAAFFWNVQGGGIDLVNMVLNEALGGHPKALSTLMERNGLSQIFEQLKTLLSSGEDDETPEQADTSATNTPPGS